MSPKSWTDFSENGGLILEGGRHAVHVCLAVSVHGRRTGPLGKEGGRGRRHPRDHSGHRLSSGPPGPYRSGRDRRDAHSGSSELRAARRRIAELESELVTVKRASALFTERSVVRQKELCGIVEPWRLREVDPS